MLIFQPPPKRGDMEQEAKENLPKIIYENSFICVMPEKQEFKQIKG